VWFPTFDADHHVKHFKDAPEGIKVLGADGGVLPAVREVLKICAERKLVVHTGHLSPSEALAIIEAGRDMGVDRMVVTHAQFEVVNMSFEQMKKAASMGAKLELCAMGPLMGPEAHMEWMRHWRRVKVEETAAAVKEVGAQNFILATDLGQTGSDEGSRSTWTDQHQLHLRSTGQAHPGGGLCCDARVETRRSMRTTQYYRWRVQISYRRGALLTSVMLL